MSINKTSRFADTCTVNVYFQDSGGATQSYIGRANRAWIDTVSYSDNIPNWRSRLAQGINCSTELTGTRSRARSRFGTATYRTDNKVFNYWQRYVATGEFTSCVLRPNGFNLPSASLLNEARSQAEISFTKNFRNRTRQWQSGVFAGELLQTAKMLANPVSSLSKAATKLTENLLDNTAKAARRSRNRVENAKAVSQAITGTYLEWQYGIAPLASDCDDAAKAFRAMASGRTFDMIRILGDGVAEQATSSKQLFVAGPGWPTSSRVQAEYTTKYLVEVRLNGGWRSDKPGGQLPVPMMLGTTLGDVLPTAWELVPWSFLIDYFSNIGDVLDTWGMRFIDFAWLNETVRRTTEVKIALPAHVTWKESDWPYVVHNVGVGSKPTKGIRRIVTRLPYNNSWTPSIQAELPGLGSRKWLNISALLAARKVPSYISQLG